MADWTKVFIQWFEDGDGYRTPEAVASIARGYLPNLVQSDNPAVQRIVERCKEIVSAPAEQVEVAPVQVMI